VRFGMTLISCGDPAPARLTGSSSAVTLAKVAWAQLLLTPDDMEDKHLLAIVAVEHAAWRLDDLTVARAAKLPQHRSALGISGELFYVFEDPLDEAACGFRLVDHRPRPRRSDIGRIPLQWPHKYPR